MLGLIERNNGDGIVSGNEMFHNHFLRAYLIFHHSKYRRFEIDNEMIAPFGMIIHKRKEMIIITIFVFAADGCRIFIQWMYYSDAIIRWANGRKRLVFVLCCEVMIFSLISGVEKSSLWNSARDRRFSIVTLDSLNARCLILPMMYVWFRRSW